MVNSDIDKGGSKESETSNLIDRISNIESEINQIKNQQFNITETIEKLSERIEDAESRLSDVEDTVENREEDIMVTESRIKNINRSIDNLQDEISKTKSDVKVQDEQITDRLSAIEHMMDIDEIDIARNMKPGACELEQLSTLPEESRKEEYPVRVQRAVALYENYHRISTPIKNGGERVLSKDVKTFLNGYSDNDIQYTQVQRVMDSFVEKTGEEYYNQSTGDGRAIIYE